MERFEIELMSNLDQRKFYDNVRMALCCGSFMQVAHKEGEKGNYLTVKDNQVFFSLPIMVIESKRSIGCSLSSVLRFR